MFIRCLPPVSWLGAIWFVMAWCIVVLVVESAADVPKFRILAPQFICPKDDDTPIDKPDNTVITVQTVADADFDLTWTVRWTPLPAPTQRFTLLVWRAVRALEDKLNQPQPEPYVYIIDNDELLHGINYEFSVTPVDRDGETGVSKTFNIDNSQGDQKLGMVEGRSDLLSVMLLGTDFIYRDLVYVSEALVTSCVPTQDYYFIWTVQSTESSDHVDVSKTNGSRLEVPAFSLKDGQTYDVNCQIIKHSDGYRITQTGISFQVRHRGLKVYLNVDYLIVPINHAFAIEATVLNHDYYDESVVIMWECKFASEPCDFFESSDTETLMFPLGLPKLGTYEIKVVATILNEQATAVVNIDTVDRFLPVLQIAPLPRLLNEGTTIPLVVNASNVAPTCTMTWYFASKEYLSANFEINSTCVDCEEITIIIRIFHQHGEALSDTLTIYSLEENFLNELTDFSNETEWRQVTAEMPATAGRARFVAHCECSLTFECATQGMVYADMTFQMNTSPTPGNVTVSPDLGSALETVFRISTTAAIHPDTPLRYSYYCSAGNGSVLLGSYLEYLSVETLLPYHDGGTEVWLQVCDSLGACANSDPIFMDEFRVHDGGTEVWLQVCDSLGACANSDPVVVHLSPGAGSTIETLIEEARAHVRRCELMALQRNALSAIVTYNNAGQADLAEKFISTLMESLPTVDVACFKENYGLYSALLRRLGEVGVDTTTFPQ